MFLVIILISIYNFGIYLILVLSICNAIQSPDCHVRYFNKLSIYLSIYLSITLLKLEEHCVTKINICATDFKTINISPIRIGCFHK